MPPALTPALPENILFSTTMIRRDNGALYSEKVHGGFAQGIKYVLCIGEIIAGLSKEQLRSLSVEGCYDLHIPRVKSFRHIHGTFDYSARVEYWTILNI